MTKIRCLIVEDQLPAQRVLETYISELEHVELHGVCSSAAQAMALLQTKTFDLIFLDIHLPKMDGFSFLRTLPNPPNVIVTTAYSEHALEGFELNVIDYLLKPFSFERFCRAVSKVKKDLAEIPSASNISANQSLFIKTDGDFVRLDIDNLVHISSDGNFLNINMVNTRYYILGSLHSWLEKLPREKFMRVQKSHIVNLNHIEKISGNRITTVRGPVPIGRAYKDSVLKKVIKTCEI